MDGNELYMIVNFDKTLIKPGLNTRNVMFNNECSFSKKK